MQLTPIKLSVLILVSLTYNYIISFSLLYLNYNMYNYIGKIIISPSGSPIAGESYTLECSAGGSEGTFQWLGPPDGRTPVIESSPRLNIISNAESSQLQFRPLQQSDNGSYSCNARSVLLSEPVIISVNGIMILN